MKMLILGVSIIALTSLSTAFADQTTNQPASSNTTSQVVTNQENTADATKPKDEITMPSDQKNAATDDMSKTQEEKNKKEEMDQAKKMAPTMIAPKEPVKDTAETAKDKTDKDKTDY